MIHFPGIMQHNGQNMYGIQLSKLKDKCKIIPKIAEMIF